MRKTSQDGGDTSSITSGVENEIKKPGVLIKTKKNSIKRKGQNFSNEYDETVIEPLLQKDNEKIETTIQSAKYLLKTTKTDIISAKGNDNNTMFTDSIKILPAKSTVLEKTTTFTSVTKDNGVPQCFANAPTGVGHNHMNTNVFAGQNLSKSFMTPNTQILVEIDGTKQTSYNSSPLIFTTAKIHTDGKTKHMEPVQVTPVPILSIIEVSALKTDVADRERRSKEDVAVSGSFSNANNVKSMDKDIKSTLNTTFKNTPEILNNKTTTTTTSDHNVLNKTSPIAKVSDFVSPITAVDATLTKTTTTANNVKDEVIASLPIDKTKEESIVRIPPPQASLSTKVISNIPVKSIATTSKKTIDVNNTKEPNVKVDTSLVPKKLKDDVTNDMRKTDINRNIQSVAISSIEPQYSGKTTNASNAAEKSKIEKSLKSHSSSSSSKQLQRQKNTKIDDTNDSDVASKSTTKEATEKLVLSQTKISGSNISSDSGKITPKSNSINENTMESIPKLTATVTNNSKSIICSASSIKPSISNNVVPVSTMKSSDTSTNQLNLERTKSSTTIKPSAATATIKQATGVATTTNINKQETSIGLTKVNSQKAMVTTSKPTTSVSSVTQMKSPSNKPLKVTPVSAPTTLHSASMKTSSSHESTSVTKATSKDTKPSSSNKNPSTATVHSGAAVKSTVQTKKGGQKSSDQNNDGKSSKA